MMSPPRPPSPPSGPPRGTNFSRWRLMSPCPPSPAVTCTSARSIMGKFPGSRFSHNHYRVVGTVGDGDFECEESHRSLPYKRYVKKGLGLVIDTWGTIRPCELPGQFRRPQ